MARFSPHLNSGSSGFVAIRSYTMSLVNGLALSTIRIGRPLGVSFFFV